MKTNKLWSIIMMLVLVLGTVITFSSCSSDEDNDNENATQQSQNNPLYGSWRVWFSSQADYKTGDGEYWGRRYTIKNDGSLEVYGENWKKTNGKVTVTKLDLEHKGTWSYDSTQKMIVLKFGNQTYYYYVTHVDNTSMLWLGLDGGYTELEEV